MDVRFLKSISEAYVIDTELNITPEIVFNEVYGIVKLLRDYDLELYNELYETTKLYQQRIIKGYLDQIYEQVKYTSEDEEIINEELALTIAGATVAKAIAYVLGLVTMLIFKRPLTKAVMATISFLGKGIEKLGQFLTRHGKYMQMRYSIIQENSRKCFVKCGIDDPSKISIFSYASIRHTGSGTKESAEQAKCLRDCYIENLIELIALHMECYFACLKKTGGFETLNKTDTDDLMKMISSVNLGASCEGFYNQAKEALDLFYKTIEFVYDKEYDEDLRLEMVNKLRQKIYQARQTIQRSDARQLQRYGQKPEQFQQQ